MSEASVDSFLWFVAGLEGVPPKVVAGLGGASGDTFLDGVVGGTTVAATALLGVASCVADVGVTALGVIVSAVPGLVVAAAAEIWSALLALGMVPASPRPVTPVEGELAEGGGASTFALFASGLAIDVPDGTPSLAVVPVDPVANGCVSASAFADLASTAGSEETGFVLIESALVVELRDRSFFGSRSDKSVMTGCGM